MPWALSLPDGRYLLRHRAQRPDVPPSHVLVIATLGAMERRHALVGRRGRRNPARPQPDPAPVTTGRATVIDVAAPFAEEGEAAAWLGRAGEEQLAQDLEVLNWVLHTFRAAIANPYLHPVSRDHLLVARVGYGAGEQVADGLWADARELVAPVRRQRRSRVLAPQARLARLLGGGEQPLVCEELTLRARLDLDQGRDREAALQVLVALDAAIAELAADPRTEMLDTRVAELRDQRDPLADAAQAALAGPLDAGDLETVQFALERIEATLRARTLARE